MDRGAGLPACRFLGPPAPGKLDEFTANAGIQGFENRFPLTPALSLGEREEPPPPRVFRDGWPTPDGGTLFPLPRGEG